MSNAQASIRVAVYGTLKQNHSNHVLLKGARFLGSERLFSITLYDLGPFPAALERPSRGVTVEVYEVNIPLLARLDELEDYKAGAPRTGLYTRKLLKTAFGPAWVYLFNKCPNESSRLPDGDWKGSSITVRNLRRAR
ncbi:gamma-glutamylcyclotransferase family protein [Marinobacter salicampi]|uniref:gamma-glutamylcyclotransferase family protein n=1 Tax=Marinobacter salicampi TaxID=435907 RepID=UPI00140D5C8E|nr:gamma-glutamylcyclotransferase family protein [Marinobacter salicampi]